MMRTVVKKELRGYFNSAIAVIFLAAFLAVAFYTFFWREKFFARGTADLRPLFEWMPKLLIVDDAGEPVPSRTPGSIYLKMLGTGFVYKGDPAKTAENRLKEYFTVGDIGYLDEDGFLYLCDRKADMIISGGANIYPAEIENEIMIHPKVADVAVFGIPDEDWGEQIKAIIEPAPGSAAGPELAAEILASLEGRLARMKWPKSIDFIEEMPREPNGKLLKRKLRAPYWEGHDRAI